ncbi:MAG: GntR family transcriptional regulator [Rhodospirillales bacterium]
MDNAAALAIEPIDTGVSLKDRIYQVLKDAISKMDIYTPNANLRLDERQLSESLGISRTPLREALARLEQEGLIAVKPRRGVYVVRKTMAEIIDAIHVWAAIEGMAARLACEHATNAEISDLRLFVTGFRDETVQAHIDEYSQRNVEFHHAIINLSKSKLISDIAAQLFMHMRGIRTRTIGDEDRANRSIIDHSRIIEALEARDAARAERLVSDHALNLAEHVRAHCGFLDEAAEE